MTQDKKIWLPPGVTPRDDDEKDKNTIQRGTVRYPSKEFASKFYAICEKAKVSMNEVLVALAGDFISKNEFLLERKGK